VPVAACDFLEGEKGEHAFAAKWDKVSGQVNQRKQRKWRDLREQDFFRDLFEPQEKGGVESACEVCRHEGVLAVEDGIAKCQRCRSFEKLGRQLRQPQFLAVFDVADEEPPLDATWHQALRAFGADVRVCEDKEDLNMGCPRGALSATVYRFDTADFLVDVPDSWQGLPVSFDFRWLADATPRKGEDEVAEYSDLAQAAKGVKWLGILRMDVDSLGQLFRSRLGSLGTISRMSTLSESLRLFFEGWVPTLCRSYNTFPRNSIFLIYAGGDDLFLVGAWSELPELACKIREDFRKFVGGDHVTLSGGIAIEHQKYPLYQLAGDAKQALDDKAKEHRRSISGREVAKDALCFLQTPIGWERFQEMRCWKDQLVEMIEKPPDSQPALPQNFLTRLTEIHALYSSNVARRRRFRYQGAIKTDTELREMIHYDKWQWQMVYHLARFSQRYPHFTPKIHQLQRDVAREQDGLISVLHLLARWVALLTREE
jgi:CRISPR-associated protein Csm1